MDRNYAGKKLARMRPDAVELFPAARRADVIDATQRYKDDPCHSFKTRVCAAAIRLATGMDTEAVDFLATFRQTPH